MQYLTVSFSHKNCDMRTREQLGFSQDSVLEVFMRKCLCASPVNEIILLSTCNRIEVIASVKDPFAASDFIFERLAEHSGISREELEGRADVFEDNGAVHHLFAVAASLDSQVVGETQITGQLKDAFKYAFDNQFCSQKLSRAMHFAFKCAAEIRNSTSIQKNPVSVASTAVSNAKALLGDLGGLTALVIGVGEMGILTTKHLVAQGCNVIILNRNTEKAKEMASHMGDLVRVEPISKMTEYINRYKLLFSATGAPHAIITPEEVESKNFERYWFDLAMPRDIEGVDHCNIHLYAVDDLKEIVDQNLTLREEQAKIAYSIVGRYVMEFYKWLQSLSVDPVIKSLRDKAKDAGMKELDRAIKKGYYPEDMREQLEKTMHAAFNAFLHSPTSKVKEIADDPSADMVIESLRLLFDIEQDAKMLNKYKCEEFMVQKKGHPKEIKI